MELYEPECNFDEQLDDDGSTPLKCDVYRVKQRGERKQTQYECCLHNGTNLDDFIDIQQSLDLSVIAEYIIDKRMEGKLRVSFRKPRNNEDEVYTLLKKDQQEELTELLRKDPHVGRYF